MTTLTTLDHSLRYMPVLPMALQAQPVTRLLSILIPTLPERHHLFSTLYAHLTAQINRLKAHQHIEIVALMDDMQRSIGMKRNALKWIAQGEYIVFVDDDDEVSSDYVQEIYQALASKPDVVTFDSMVTVDGGKAKKCIFDARFEQNNDYPSHYERLPNHLCPVRSALAPNYPDLSFGEDTHYAMELKPRIKTSVRIDKTLYFYLYHSSTSRSAAH